MKKTIITLLLAAMMLSTLAACGDSGAADNTDAGNTAAETQTADPAKETTALEARLAVQDELP
ncbi:MAG: methionine ABC transporter substrate-binding protein, partial [Clostridia bacterium]|nr:methionine ABC transporter substrate-binding protein [Clostridia bacterium]